MASETREFGIQKGPQSSHDPSFYLAEPQAVSCSSEFRDFQMGKMERA
jgi:hypothetical protein